MREKSIIKIQPMKIILLLILTFTVNAFLFGQKASSWREDINAWRYLEPINSKTDSVTLIKDTARYYTNIGGKPFMYAMRFFNYHDPKTYIDSLRIWPFLSNDSIKLSSGYKNYNNNLVDSIWLGKDTTFIFFRYYKK